MSITDELREYARIHQPYKSELYNAQCADEITAIADRIDAEHERECKEQYACGVEHGIGASIDASMIQTHGYVELPKDADGEYIHVGDEMCGYGWPNGGVYCRAIVNVATILVGPQDGAYRGWLMWATNECRHYHAPTVEDVLREMLFKAHIYDKREMELLPDLIAEYAKRLTLIEMEDA